MSDGHQSPNHPEWQDPFWGMSLSLWKLPMIRPLLSTSSGPNVEGHWDLGQWPPYRLKLGLLASNSPTHQLTPPPTLLPAPSISSKTNRYLASQFLLSPASALTHPRQHCWPSPSLAHCPVQGSFLQEASWTRPAQCCVPPPRSTWCLSHGRQHPLTLQAPASLLTPQFPSWHSNSHTLFSPFPFLPFLPTFSPSVLHVPLVPQAVFNPTDPQS